MIKNQCCCANFFLNVRVVNDVLVIGKAYLTTFVASKILKCVKDAVMSEYLAVT